MICIDNVVKKSKFLGAVFLSPKAGKNSADGKDIIALKSIVLKRSSIDYVF